VAFFALADLHLSFARPKPMERFGEHWRDHPAKIAAAWRESVGPDDTVLLAGDLSWALRRVDAEADLAWIAALPGRKVLIKGNHDYWWKSDRPLRCPGLEQPPLVIDGIGIAGTRGWEALTSDLTPTEAAERQRYLDRETERLARSLLAVADAPTKVVMLHYPPRPFLPVLREAGVRLVVYGHLHLNGHEAPKEGIIDGMEWRCVAADRLDFRPLRLFLESEVAK
jgi:uncharacterized protein